MDASPTKHPQESADSVLQKEKQKREEENARQECQHSHSMPQERTLLFRLVVANYLSL